MPLFHASEPVPDIGRHADAGLRIWRMLRHHGQLEESKIADASLMPPKEARSMLYALLASGFVTVQVWPTTPFTLAWIWLLRKPTEKSILPLSDRPPANAHPGAHTNDAPLGCSD